MDNLFISSACTNSIFEETETIIQLAKVKKW